MSEHNINLNWQRTSEDFGYKTYNREHKITYKNGLTIDASAAVNYLGSPDCVDPEEAFVGALSSCHMLTFLALASMKKFVIDSYIDDAVGVVGKVEGMKMAMTDVTLNPKVQFTGDNRPTDEDIAQMHHKAHEQCFIANSVTTKVVVNH